MSINNQNDSGRDMRRNNAIPAFNKNTKNTNHSFSSLVESFKAFLNQKGLASDSQGVGQGTQPPGQTLQQQKTFVNHSYNNVRGTPSQGMVNPASNAEGAKRGFNKTYNQVNKDLKMTLTQNEKIFFDNLRVGHVVPDQVEFFLGNKEQPEINNIISPLPQCTKTTVLMIIDEFKARELLRKTSTINEEPNTCSDYETFLNKLEDGIVDKHEVRLFLEGIDVEDIKIHLSDKTPDDVMTKVKHILQESESRRKENIERMKNITNKKVKVQPPPPFHAILLKEVDKTIDSGHPLKLRKAIKAAFPNSKNCKKLQSGDLLVIFESAEEMIEALNSTKITTQFGKNAYATHYHDAKRTFVLYGMPTVVTKIELIEATKQDLNIDIRVNKIVHPSKKRSTVFIEALNDKSFDVLSKAKFFPLGCEKLRILPRKEKLFKQCSKCYGFDHTAITCKKEVICKFCSGNHTNLECKEKDVKCSNCSGAHEADDKVCPSFTAYKKRKREELVKKNLNNNRFFGLKVDEDFKDDKDDKNERNIIGYSVPKKKKKKKKRVRKNKPKNPEEEDIIYPKAVFPRKTNTSNNKTENKTRTKVIPQQESTGLSDLLDQIKNLTNTIMQMMNMMMQFMSNFTPVNNNNNNAGYLNNTGYSSF